MLVSHQRGSRLFTYIPYLSFENGNGSVLFDFWPHGFVFPWIFYSAALPGAHLAVLKGGYEKLWIIFVFIGTVPLSSHKAARPNVHQFKTTCSWYTTASLNRWIYENQSQIYFFLEFGCFSDSCYCYRDSWITEAVRCLLFCKAL